MTEVQSDKLVTELQKRINDSDLAVRLGKTSNTIDNWQKKPSALSSARVASLVKGAMDAEAKRERENILKALFEPIVEYFPIEKGKQKGKVKNRHQIQLGIQTSEWPELRDKLDKLEKSRGIYIFYDTRGHAIYVGKTERKTLWAEMDSAFNSKPTERQVIYRTAYSGPKINRDLSKKDVYFNELARYFSAYEVHRDMIPSMEALFIRAFANNLMNKKMETGNLFNK